MSDSDSDDSNDSLSVGYAFDLPQFNLSGLRIFVGHRREASVHDNYGNDRMGWGTDRAARDNPLDPNDLGFDRGFLGPRSPVSRLMGQAIDLALRMMETQKSIDIMTGVAKRMVDDSPQAVLHITPRTTRAEVQSLARNWLSILRRQEFFRIQLIETGRSNPSVMYWTCSVRDRPITLSHYYPHNAGMLGIDVKVCLMTDFLSCWPCDRANMPSKIVEKLLYHASANSVPSAIEWQKCLFHVANLIINQVQCFWVAFLWPDLADPRANEPLAVHSTATVGLVDFYGNPSAGFHWDAEFFGGRVEMHHRRDDPSTHFNQYGGFGRALSIGSPYLNRADGSEQLITMNSITRCLSYGKHTSRLGKTHQRGGFSDYYNVQGLLTQPNRLLRGPAEGSESGRDQSSSTRLRLPRLFCVKRTAAAWISFCSQVIPMPIKLHVSS